MNKVKTVKDLNKNVLTKIKSFENVSTKIRYLNSLKYSQGDISRILTKTENKLVRFQWVNNVLKVKVKNPKELF